MTTYTLPGFKARPKARPISGKGRMYVPREYQQWKGEIRAFLAVTYAPIPTQAPVSVAIELHGPNRPRGDLDNLAGGLLDAIQPPRAKGDVRAQHQLEASVSLEDRLAAATGTLIADDKQVVRLSIAWIKSRKRAIILRLEESVSG